MPQIIITIGALLLLVGLAAMVRSIKGHLIATPPLCRKCKYDLSGLEISVDGHCPERGRTVLDGTRSVRRSQRKFRLGLLLCSLLMISTGSIGLAFPKIMGMPAFDRVDLYSSRSEISLMVFERVGDERAEIVLYQKLMRGELSDRGVDRLTKLAIKKYQTEQAGSLHSRWNHVMSLAMLEHRLSDEQLHAFIEHQVTTKFKIRTEIHPDDPEVFAIVWIDEPGFVSRTNFARVPWRKRQGMPIDVRFESPFTLGGKVFVEVISGNHTSRQEIGSITSPILGAH